MKSDIWIWDLVREYMTRLTFNGDSYAPLWTRDGRRIVYITGFLDKTAVHWKAADGTGAEDKISSMQVISAEPASWSSDGKTLVLEGYSTGAGLNLDIGALSMEGGRKWRPLLEQKHNEGQPKISPDGRWMAYTSDESGQDEVYVRPFPEVDKGRRQVSINGGNNPLWSPDGRELFYRMGDSVMGTGVQTEPTFEPGKPIVLFQGKYVSQSPIIGISWDISPEGKRFLMMKEAVSAEKPAAAEVPRKINVVLNLFEELKQRVPAK